MTHELCVKMCYTLPSKPNGVYCFMSHFIRKPAYCICKNRGADQLCKVFLAMRLLKSLFLVHKDAKLLSVYFPVGKKYYRVRMFFSSDICTFQQNRTHFYKTGRGSSVSSVSTLQAAVLRMILASGTFFHRKIIALLL